MAAENPVTPQPEARKLNKVEAIKLAKDGLDVWNDIFTYATQSVPPLSAERQELFLKAGGRPEELTAAARAAAITEDDFVRIRWYGTYQQLPNVGHFMMRIRIPNGFLTPAQLREISKLSADYGRGFGDITTRQCIQLHWLTIETLPDIFRRLEKVGLVSKFACGDTPRNVVGCPLAGHLAAEIIDPRPEVAAINQMFLEGNKEFSNFPRKFKSAIAGCHLHCHQPQINDFGAFGVTRVSPISGREERGYGVVVGGGLSTQPHMAQGLRAFITAEQLPAVARGIAHIFRDHGYRDKRTRARLKYLVADWGWEKFRDYLEDDIGFKLTHDPNIVSPEFAPHTDHMGTGPQKQPGLSYIGVPVERGRVTSDQMAAAADIADACGAAGLVQIGLSNKQNLLFMNIPTPRVAEMCKLLDGAGLSPHAPLWRTNLVSCTGTQFCNLAIVETKQRAQRILKFLEEDVQIDSPIMVSVTGCPNSCAQYQIADIGLMGVVCNFRGQRGTEAYNIVLGGTLGADPHFGSLTLKKVPADYVHKAIQGIVEAYKAHRLDEDETFRMFVQRHPAEQLAQWLTIPEMAEVV